MKFFNLALIYFCTILTLCTLYAVQPIQPVFEQEFALDRFQAIIFTTVIMLPLGFAPILYGYFLEIITSRVLLRASVLILGILELLFAASDTYSVLLFIRALQGLIIPALLTSLMSFISYASTKEKVQQAIGFYIGVTIFGGFLGRLLSGFFTDMYSWRFFFVVLGVLLIAMFFALHYLEEDVKLNISKPSIKQIVQVVKQKVFLHIYLIMFTTFFAFQAILNFIPFRISMLTQNIDNTKIGLVYAGYIIGLIISFRVLAIIRFFDSEVRAMIAGVFIYMLGVQFFHLDSYNLLFFGMFVFCAGMFIIHAVASGYISKLAHTNRAISNGLYIAFYYSGGILGSFAPGVIFEYFGWHAFVFVLSFFILVAIFLLFRLKRLLAYSKNIQEKV